MGQNIPPQATSSMLLRQHWLFLMKSFGLKASDSGHSEIKSKDIYESRTSHLKPLPAASAVNKLSKNENYNIVMAALAEASGIVSLLELSSFYFVTVSW